MGTNQTLICEAETSRGEKPDRDRNRDPLYGKAAPRHEGESKRCGEEPQYADRALTLAWAAREYIWLYDHNHGISISEIAAREGLSVARVKYGVGRAEAMDKRFSDAQHGPSSLAAEIAHAPRLVPLFPIGPYTPQSSCPHFQPIEPGSTLCCMVCHSSGLDAHPALRRDPRTDPAPEPEDEPAPELASRPEAGELHETRKQRRRRMFAQQAATAPNCVE